MVISMGRAKLFLLSTIILFVLNAALVGFMTYTSASTKRTFFPEDTTQGAVNRFIGKMPDEQGRQMPLHERIRQELDLDSAQVAQHLRLRTDHRKRMDEHDNLYNKTLQRYFDLLSKGAMNSEDKESLERLMAKIVIGKADLTYNHFVELSHILRPDQKEKFQKILPQLVSAILSPPRRPPGERGPEGGMPLPPGQGGPREGNPPQNGSGNDRPLREGMPPPPHERNMPTPHQ